MQLWDLVLDAFFHLFTKFFIYSFEDTIFLDLSFMLERVEQAYVVPKYISEFIFEKDVVMIFPFFLHFSELIMDSLDICFTSTVPAIMIPFLEEGNTSFGEFPDGVE